MRLSHLTFTGADDGVDPNELARLSAEAPLIEWGILLSFDADEGRPRFPSHAWRTGFYRLAPNARRAAHLCGGALLAELAAGRSERALALSGELKGRPNASTASPPYQRLQLNFDARELPPAVLTAWAAQQRAGQWHRGDGRSLSLITQHYDGNAQVREAFDAAVHTVLFDRSGGRGLNPSEWPRPIAGLQCGYAGGLGPHNLRMQLRRIAEAAGGEHSVWIDMEASLRIDERFVLDRVREVVEIVRELARGAPLLPGVELLTDEMT